MILAFQLACCLRTLCLMEGTDANSAICLGWFDRSSCYLLSVAILCNSLGKQEDISAIYSQITPILDVLNQGGEPPTTEIETLAANSATRSELCRSLHRIGQLHIFPEEYSSLSLIAESDLIVWLMHPSELGTVPDEIELVSEIKRSEGDPAEDYSFFVFKFRYQSMCNGDWMAGVAGPYWNGYVDDHAPPGVFSMFEAFDSRTPEDHLKKTEELILSRLWYVSVGYIRA